MLYHNALLALAYTEAYQFTKKEFYKEVTERILIYILRDMTSPEGGFYSAEDADSEGIEGKFYVWDIDEVTKILREEDGKFFCHYYDITSKGNFEKKNIPNIIEKDLSEIEENKILKDKLNALRAKLFEYREKRVHPHKDDKILTSWNGLMIAALAYAGRTLSNNNYIEVAERAVMIKLFGNENEGGFYLYGKDGEELIFRPKEIYDGALPSGNSAAAFNLIPINDKKELMDFFEL